MIQYALKCADGHDFDSWFQSAAAFDKLAAAGMVQCAVCGSGKVEKAMMTPRVRPGRNAAAPGETLPERPLSQPASAAELALARLRRKVEESSDYVGMNFAAEARAIHQGDAPERSIYGEARPEEARALIEEGVPVAPLPFTPNRKTN
ncbi:DUF1178 family protein [Antarcticimicrobium luteum]|uniref:DUF1178 family protein n=1 Tax=Antarcticimicrobium luteum TaxID=2547397 RepID=A0A4R5VC35_9RHOB|nr:DUF1178 family protein [Antarcticimicrobium luteum]TDK49624.1 DUF1178 family protein [Antarcticimicrobium luteum]